MNSDVFFDTWAWVAIGDKDDQYHTIAGSFYREFLMQNKIPVTSDYVIAETFTLLRRRISIELVCLFGDNLLKAVSIGRVRLEIITRNRWQKSWEFFKKFADKPGISFFDLTTMVVMHELGIKRIFSGDEHFEHVGLGFIRVP
jgi:predicted nucleic acid-binding protein